MLFFFNDTATTEIYTLSLHDALPIFMKLIAPEGPVYQAGTLSGNPLAMTAGIETLKLLKKSGVYRQLEERSEEHTSELQSQSNLVCRLLLEKKKKRRSDQPYHARARR